MLLNKRGTNILTENLIFIILNLVFLSILIVFLFSRMSTVAILEEKYSKQIALLIDSAKPGMRIILDMSDDIGKIEKDFDKDEIFSYDKNVVTIKFKEGKGASYSFFNDVLIFDKFDKEENKLILDFERKNE